MSIKINFDTTHNPEEPTLVLAKRNGEKMGALDARGIVVKDALTDACEIQFEVYKYLDDGVTLTNMWYSIIDFRLIWCKEWDTWFELTVELDEDTETIKTIYCTKLGCAELSQINLYDIQINTEDDIARDDYEIPTVFYNPEHPEASLLDRILEHAPHYRIRHVDETLMNIQRTFTFDSESIQDAFNDIAEEIECLFVTPSNSTSDNYIDRVIDVYDLDSNCNECGYRGDFTSVCPECGSTDIDEGYGEDTTIFVTAQELANEIQYGVDTDSVKNCFKLEGGDDLMTATIRNCNPNGSDRIWYITAQAKADMSNELVRGLADYDERYQYYQNEYEMNVPADVLQSYNELAKDYNTRFGSGIEEIESPIIGYPALMEAYYNTIDFALYLQSSLMPDASLNDTSAQQEADKLTAEAFGSETNGTKCTVAVEDASKISTASANSAALAMAKVIVDARYQVKVNDGEYYPGEGQKWIGNFKVTNYSDDEDTAISDTIELTITDDYEQYLRQMIEKSLNNDEVNDLSITYLFSQGSEDLSWFKEELKKYCLDSLTIFYDAGQACLDILIDQGVADKDTWGSDVAGADSNLYERLYEPYYNMVGAIEAEMKVREDEINTITGTYDEDGDIKTYGLQAYIIEEQSVIQTMLDFEAYLGEDLWLEFSAFRREDKYSNSNYISDGLNNAELFSNAWEFFKTAEKEIYKSAEMQHSISTTLKNLLVIPRFAPLIKYFKCGNWLRIQVDDSIYKLRLIEYEIDYDSIDKLSVDFSDVMKTLDGLSDKKSIMSTLTSVASSYDTVMHQASQGSESHETVTDWSSGGIDVNNVTLMQNADNETQTWDSHGMLFRRYYDDLEDYSDEQLKIIHSTIAVTSDNWQNVRTAIGGFYYYDPVDKTQKYAYGINGEVLVGNLILGQELGIYNSSGSMTFDENGLTITNGKNTFTVTPDNSKHIISINNGSQDVFYVSSDGSAYLTGSVKTGDTDNVYVELANGMLGFYDKGTKTTYAEFYRSDTEVSLMIQASADISVRSTKSGGAGDGSGGVGGNVVIGDTQDTVSRYIAVNNKGRTLRLYSYYDSSSGSSSCGLYDPVYSLWVIKSSGSSTIYLGGSNSSVYLGNGTAVTSDRVMKSDIKPLSTKYGELIDLLTPRAYELKDAPNETQIGFVVDEVESAMEEAGLDPDDYGITSHYEDEDGNDVGAIRYTEIIPMLVYEIQDLKKKVRDLENG